MRWYVSRNGETQGPVDEATVIEWIKAGTRDASVRDEQGGAWMPIATSPFAALHGSASSAKGRLMTRTAILFAALAAVSCVPPKTPSEQCRRELAFSNVNGKRSETAMAIDRFRCDQMAAEERAEARQERSEAKAQRANDQQEEAAKFESLRQVNQEHDARLARIRLVPKTPELGATAAEAHVVCTRESGTFVEDGGAITCEIGGPKVFVCSYGADDRIDACTTYYEGADLQETRQRFEKTFGAFDRESVADGFRVFEWDANQKTLRVTMYEGGVKTSVYAKRPVK